MNPVTPRGTRSQPCRTRTCALGTSLLVAARGLLLACCVWLWPAAAHAESPRAQLATYLLTVADLAKLEHKAVYAHQQALRKVKARSMSDEGFERVLVGQVLPAYEGFCTRLRQVPTPTAELTKVHKMFTDGAALQLAGFQGQARAIHAHDPHKILAPNRELARGGKMVEAYLKEIKKLQAIYDLR